MRQKSLVKTVWKRAFRKCERELIASVNRRDNHRCQVCPSTEVLQMDHAICSRRHLSVFFEIRQMVLLCSRCHLKKTFNQNGYGYKVSQIVRDREGSAFIMELIEKSREIKKWSITELEEMTEYFKEYCLTPKD